MMSTYNGEAYLQEQVDSIFTQKEVNPFLFIRDDGSTDGTRDVLTRLKEEHPDSIELFFESNIGVTDSFLKLAKSIPMETDWYAFSDQDDVWLPNKLMTAIGELDSRISENGTLFASATLLCDEGLGRIGVNDCPNLQFDLYAEFTRHRLSGHTMVFDKQLLSLLRKVETSMGFPYDHLLCVLAAANRSSFIFDRETYVLHRRGQRSVTPGGNGIVKRLSHECNLVMNNGGINRSAMADYLLCEYGNNLSSDEVEFLRKIVDKKGWKLIASRKIDCGLWAGNIETCISILLGRF